MHLHAFGGVLLVDRDGNVVFSNRRWRELWEIDEDVPPKGLGDLASELEESHVVRLGSGRVLHVFSAPLRSEDGGGFGRGWYVHDVTHQSRLAELGKLSASVAHEISNPLVYVLNNLEHVRSVLSQRGETGDLVEALDDAIFGAKRVHEIVRDVKFLARNETKPHARVDVRDVIASSCKMAQPLVPPRVRLVTDLHEVPSVRGDAARLGQVVLNLLVNATQAMMEPRAEGHEIRISTRVDSAHQVIIEIADNGEGISDEVKERIFDPFFTTKPGSGTGLGLSISKGIVMAHGGEIAVESKIGEGTRFRIVLPGVDGPAFQVPVESGEVLTVQRRRVLIVDDEPKILSTIQRALMMHETVAVSCGEEAIERIAKGERFDAILCDFMLPRMTGIEVHTAIDRIAPDQAKRIIFVTGGAVTDEARAFLAAVATPCVEKPFRPVSLSTLIASFCKERAA